MPNYQNGKIYAIRSYKTEDVYIGSTTKKYLSARLAGHKYSYKRFLNGKNPYLSSFKILELEDAYIELLELYPCNFKEELCKKEGEYIRNTKNCINRSIAGRTGIEYREDNRELLRNREKIYRENNKEKLLEKGKKYREDNRDILRERHKLYRENNREKIREQQRRWEKEYNKKTYNCLTCNKILTLCNKTRHEKGKKHINNLNK